MSTTTVPAHIYNTAVDTVEVLYQQMKSNIRGTVTMLPVDNVGRLQWVPTYGTRSGWSEMGKKSGPTEADTPRTNRQRTIKRYGTQESFDVLENIQKALMEPNSQLLSTFVAEGERHFSDLFFDNVLGTVVQGSEDSTSNVTFDTSSYQVAVDYVPGGGSAVTSGITYAKFVEASRILMANFATEMGRGNGYIALTSTEWATCMRLEEIKSRLYTPSTDAVSNGSIGMVAGLNIILDERVNNDGTNDSCIAWVKDAVIMGDSGYNLVTWTDQNNGGLERARLDSVRSGALRLKEGGVVNVLCNLAAA